MAFVGKLLRALFAGAGLRCISTSSGNKRVSQTIFSRLAGATLFSTSSTGPAPEQLPIRHDNIMVVPKHDFRIMFQLLFWSVANGGLRDGGLSKSEDIRGKRPFSSVFWFFPVLFGPLQKRAKKAEKGEKGRFRLISETGGQTPLKPPSVTPSFAAAQLLPNSTCLGSTVCILGAL